MISAGGGAAGSTRRGGAAGSTRGGGAAGSGGGSNTRGSRRKVSARAGGAIGDMSAVKSSSSSLKSGPSS